MLEKVEKIKTRITDLFGTDYPIVQGGMIWVSGWKLASAVSNAGALGLLGAGSMTPELLTKHITKLKRATGKPFGVNIPIIYEHAEQQVEICLAEGVKIVFTSAGSPKRFTDKLKGAGVIVVHVVPSMALARKVEAAGCDAVVAEGTEAGGHNGFEEITSINLWPSVASGVNIPVIAAGGIATGKEMLAALALGAEGVQLGTRFALTEESSAHPKYKARAINSGEGDTKLYLCRYIPTRAMVTPYVANAILAEQRGATREELRRIRGTGRAHLGIFEGDEIEGEMEIGQAAERINKLKTAKEVVESLVEEFRLAVENLPR